MKNYKGTSGPWQHCGSDGCKDIFVQTGTRRRNAICFTDGINEEEDYANAQLISKAPQLLEALDKAKDHIILLYRAMAGNANCRKDSNFEALVSQSIKLRGELESLIQEATKAP